MLNEFDLKEKLEEIGFKIQNFQAQSQIANKVADFLVKAGLDGRKSICL